MLFIPYYKNKINLFVILFIFSQILKSSIIKTDSSMINNENITIFIHGTHTRFLTRLFKKYILLPYDLTKISDLKNKCFYKPFLKILADSNSIEFPLDSFYIFGWPGELSNTLRRNAAKKLYESIKLIIQDFQKKNLKPKITIITHSHGGNVALNLVNVIEKNDLNFYIERLVLLGCPIQAQTKEFAKNRIFKKVYNIFSQIDLIQIFDLQKFHKENRNKKVPLFSERLIGVATNIKQSRIKFNERALFHIEFILDDFLTILPSLLHEMDKLDSNILSYLIKVDIKKKIFNIIDLKKICKKIKKTVIVNN